VRDRDHNNTANLHSKWSGIEMGRYRKIFRISDTNRGKINHVRSNEAKHRTTRRSHMLQRYRCYGWKFGVAMLQDPMAKLLCGARERETPYKR